MQTAEGIDVGQIAPDFRLKGPGGQFITLSEYAGRKHVVLVFYPLAFSGVCSHQLPDVQKAMPRIEALDGVVLGVSVDSHYANEAFAQRLGLGFPLLSDFKRAVATAYGVLIPEAGYAWRATFIVDKSGKVAYKDVSPQLHDLAHVPDLERLIEALRALR
jgi:peroxiredoxin